jgi:hypothetical protein
METRKSKYFIISVDANGRDLHIECPRLNQVLVDTIMLYRDRRIDLLTLDQIVQELDIRFVDEFLRNGEKGL